MSDKSDDIIFKSIIDDLGNDENYSCSESDSELESESDSDQKINNSVKNITANSDHKKKKNKRVKKNIVVGIDLGTTNSSVAIIRNNNYEIIPDEYGNKTIPSIVSFTNFSKYVGIEAKNQLEINTNNSFYEIKRLIGRKFSDEVVQQDIPELTYNIVKEQNDGILLQTTLNDKKYITPEEISSNILQKLKIMAENYTKQKIKDAVITVPAYFTDSQRQATQDAAMIAGLNCIRIINEPTAAALMYGLQKKTQNVDKIVLVYDLGGGTLDCSILRISDGLFEVLSSTGNSHLGGADFDRSLMAYCKGYFKRKHNLDTWNIEKSVMQKLRNACERAKKLLSNDTETTIAIKNFYNDLPLFVKITRNLFKKICKQWFILCLKPVEDSIESANLVKNDIDEIILVGGATRMPTIQENLKLYFNGKELNTSVDPDEVVAAGAAIQAYILSHKSDPFSESVVLLDIVPLSLGVETVGGEMNVIVPRNTHIPTKKTRKYTTDDDNETSVTIDIYEGERAMTKDNFKIGTFDLEGIEQAPRGYAEINVTFSIDVNGVINVTAIDKKNTELKKSIIVKCNKGRLTEDEIHELIHQAENYEMQDKLERQLKRLYYEIKNLCKNITTNLNDDEFKLKKHNIDMINYDVMKIIEWLSLKKFNQRKRKEYEEVVSKIKKRYGTLILRATHETDNVKSGTIENTGIVSTTVFGNDDDDEDNNKIYEEIEKDEYGFTNETEEETKRQIKERRTYFMDHCRSIFDMISQGNLNISKNDTDELKDYINDILLWGHVKQKIDVEDYEEKINELDIACNDIMEKYNDQIFSTLDANKNSDTKKNDLEQLCFTLKSSIDNNNLMIEEEKLINLQKIVDDTLEWLIEKDVEIIQCTTNVDEIEIECINKLSIINNICDNIYQTTQNIKIDTSNTIITDNIIISQPVLQNENLSSLHVPTESARTGTSISSLKNQQNAKTLKNNEKN